MTKRIEKSFIDRMINGKLLNKRKLGLAIKYNFESPLYESLFIDKLYFPKNKFDKVICNIYEKMMPGFQYFIWNEQVKWAREYGYTLSEKFLTNFRHSNSITMHALAQMVHPYGYLNAQRRDQFIRKTSSLLPGIEAPEWAQESRRVYDIDLNSAMIPYYATKEVEKESTPSPHYNFSTYNVINNLFDQRWNIGYPSQRLFYNEDLRGDFYRTGILTNEDKKQIHGWYSDSQLHSQKDKIDSMNDDRKVEYERNIARWDNNFKTYYPEIYNNIKENKVLHKYEEAYFERNMNDIRSSIFSSKWLTVMESNQFKCIRAINKKFFVI